MPSQTEVNNAISWALTQQTPWGSNVTIDDRNSLVDKVREYFNNNSIVYGSFSYDDLIPYL